MCPFYRKQIAQRCQMKGEGSMSQTLNNLKSTLYCHFQLCRTINLAWDTNIAGLQQFCIQGKISYDIHNSAEARSHPLCSSPTLYYTTSHLNPLEKAPLRPWYTPGECSLIHYQLLTKAFHTFQVISENLNALEDLFFNTKQSNFCSNLWVISFTDVQQE